MIFPTYFALVACLAPLAFAVPTSQPTKRALPRLGGVNLAGCDFGINTSGSVGGSATCPNSSQISHFVNDGVNAIRVPFGWQYITPSWDSPSLSSDFFSAYDKLVRGVLDAGAYAMIDLHNYARWDGQIVGQGGPTDDNLAAMWTLLAEKYADDDKVIFGIMNEPHDLDIDTWATTVQTSVNAIRAAGATSQAIALPGTDYTAVGGWGGERNDALLDVADPSHGSDKSLLLIDAHIYLDSTSAGTGTECTRDGTDDLKLLATWLSANGRKAIISETGGGNTDSCKKYLGQELKYISDNSNLFTGFTIWSAGAFDSNYELSITPVDGVDNDLFNTAIKAYLPGYVSLSGRGGRTVANGAL
ncbi:hypothetical protein L198_07193 [Cryptococcus wingfieldii CBS 7118]|uniref:cellulase n=1 Tax=Cryptococcus wingfieldii CBS 7118 TaxID=1295528 RepID=A0A1E3IE06_9TREE|nr:hypothetical protein L198_07193 [Cryptococcus wingfieldii CBS 7118]ODN86830.1 hypothetical protein L198_07193 [Cryptococcus wingfieldii CBS 7118]